MGSVLLKTTLQSHFRHHCLFFPPSFLPTFYSVNVAYTAEKHGVSLLLKASKEKIQSGVARL